MMGDAEDILAVLNSEEKVGTDPFKEFNIPRPIKVAKNVYENSINLGKKIRELTGVAYEWYGFSLISKADPEAVIRDVLVGMEQWATTADVKIPGESVGKAVQEVRNLNRQNRTDLIIDGMYHNHGDFGTFHSGTDDENFNMVLNSVSLNTERPFPADFNMFESGIVTETTPQGFVIRGKDENDAKVTYLFPNAEAFEAVLKKYSLNPAEGFSREGFISDLIKILETDIKQSNFVGFGSSVVVSIGKYKPYGAMGVVQQTSLTLAKKINIIGGVGNSEGYPVEVVSVDKDIPLMDDKEIEKLVEERISFTHYSTYYGGDGYQGQDYGDGYGDPYYWPYGEYGGAKTAATAWDGPKKWTPAKGGVRKGGRRGRLDNFGKPSYVKPGFNDNLGPRKVTTFVPKQKDVVHVDAKKQAIAQGFTNAAMFYLSNYKIQTCLYAEYVDALMLEFARTESGRIVDAVFRAGDFLPDPQHVQRPVFGIAQATRASSSIEYILNKNGVIPEEVGFLTKFTDYNVPVQNNVLETYVPMLLAMRKKINGGKYVPGNK